jgi:leader peptidase (prepilin peptidase)/N-methyltransferase
MILFPLVTFFILGLLLGSFLNVVLLRMERGEGFVRGRSRCLSCNTTLLWFDNIPLLSFLFLRGRCRYCKVALSYQYPLVELLTGALLTAALLPTFWYETGSVLQILFVLFVVGTVCFGVLITVYDILYREIPIVFLWGLCLSLTILIAGHWLLGGDPHSFLPTLFSTFWGALVSGGFFFLLVFVSRETWMGWGDVWIGAWAGALLGIELVQLFITLSFSLGALVGLTLLYRKQKNLKSEVPFAPYLLLGAFVLLVCKVCFPVILGFLSPWFLATM